MELKDLARIVKQRRTVVVLVTLVVTVLAASRGFAPESSYSASAEVLAPQTTVSAVVAPERPSDDVEWQASIARSPEVLERASSTLGDTSARQLAGAVRVAASTTTSEYLLTVTASSAEPERAAAMANAVANAYVAVTAERLKGDVEALLSGQSATDGSATALLTTLRGLPSLDSGHAHIVRAAVAPTPQSSVGRVARLGLLGLTLGLVLGIAGAFIAEQLDDTLRSAADIRKRTGASIIAGLLASGASAEDADTLLIVSNRLRYAGDRVVLVASTDSSALARSSALALSGALVRSGARAVIVDCDLRDPVDAFGSGLGEALAAPDRSGQFVVQLKNGAAALGMTTSEQDPLRLLASGSMRALVDDLRDDYDVVLLLGAPWTQPADLLAVTPLATTAVVTVALAKSRARALDDLARALSADAVDITAVLAQGFTGWDQRPMPNPDAIGI